MLETLSVTNLGIVEKAEIGFGPGLNVITGETGAGKSIIVGAIALLLGERSDKGMIRSGEDRCVVETTVRLADSSKVDAVLEELGLQSCDDGRLIVRRIVSRTGSGKVVVNDAAATVQTLKRIGAILIDLHGPHDHQSLLSDKTQLDILDSFGGCADELWAYEGAYREMLSAERKLHELQGGDDSEISREIDYLTHDVDEIEGAELTEEDEDDLVARHAEAANASRIQELCGGIVHALTEADESAFNGMTAVHNFLSELDGLLDDAAAWKEDAESISVQIRELSRVVADRVGDVSADPQVVQQIEERMGLVHKLKRRYGGSIAEILEHARSARARLEELENRGALIEELRGSLDALRKRVKDCGEKLSKKRKKAAAALEERITEELRGLGFKQSEFHVQLEKVEPGPSGLDGIHFAFAPNPGEDTRSLKDIASSGEISRVMLAVKSVLSEHDRVPVLVFDEIDTNVGGKTGTAIGARLARIASRHQVVCITHLPQVAVKGSSHLVVTKKVQKGRTVTGIVAVEDQERVEEIARMLGGRDATSVTLKHAEELLASE